MIDRIESWFASNRWTPFEFQRRTWRAYLNGESGLVHAPTGMGKTYAVWMGPMAEFLAEQSNSAMDSHLRVLWLTPLRALANDTAANLQRAVDGLNIPWKVELRTGDTSQSIRKKQRAQLPPALITTPESLSVMLSYPRAAANFRGVLCVIVDEWHELLGTKRGVQTELCLVHLRSLSPAMRTWGLSATLGNLQQAMSVLIGPRGKGTLIHGDHPKTITVETLRPNDIERFPWSGHIGTRLLARVIETIESARTTLLFTNVRSQAEIWFQQIIKHRSDLIGQIALHHGSLDRDIRNEVEHLLRDGRIRCVVCTSSLDLGVDFSPVDQVLQLGSPKGIARLMQRAGRSGHQPGAASRIIGVPTNALELVEFAAARDAVGCGEASVHTHVESREPLDRPLDVLVQHMVTLAAGDGFTADDLQREVRTTHAFANLSDEEWSWAMNFVSGGGPALTAYPRYAKVVNANDRWAVGTKQIERLHRMSIGTITSDAMMRVAFTSGTTLGNIEESFISRLRPGDRFVFAGRVLELVRVHQMTVLVERAKQKTGIVPRWMGGRSPLSTLLSRAIRQKLDEARRGVFSSPEMQMVRPLLETQADWSRIPAPDELLIEQCESRDGHHVFIYPFEGRLVHEGLSALVAHRIASAAATDGAPRSMHITANDYGFELLTMEPINLDDDEWRQAFTQENLIEDLLECLNTTALAQRAFRDIARIAGLIFTGYPGQPSPARHLQASSEMFYEVFTQFDPSNLLLDQARREVLDRELEVTRLRSTLERIASSRIVMTRPANLTPLGFPLWAESIRTQHVSAERWEDRVRRMVVVLENEAVRTKEGNRTVHRERRYDTVVETNPMKRQAITAIP